MGNGADVYTALLSECERIGASTDTPTRLIIRAADDQRVNTSRFNCSPQQHAVNATAIVSTVVGIFGEQHACVVCTPSLSATFYSASAEAELAVTLRRVHDTLPSTQAHAMLYEFVHAAFVVLLRVACLSLAHAVRARSHRRLTATH
jgi:hypothetical protein